MRHRVALMTMALGLVAAASAQANDASQLIYDLSAMKNQPVAHATSAPKAKDHNFHVTSLPFTTPSLNVRPGDSGAPYSGDALELREPNHHAHVANGVGAPRGGDTQPNQPTPNPEPGTLMLLGGALASGARFVRRRRAN